jgi:hypothetical protein
MFFSHLRGKGKKFVQPLGLHEGSGSTPSPHSDCGNANRAVASRITDPPDRCRKRKTGGGTGIPTTGKFHSVAAISLIYASGESRARANRAGGAK